MIFLVKHYTARILSVALAIIITALLICSCGYKEIEPNDSDLTVVGYVDGREVYLDELKFVTYTYRDILTAQHGENIFDGDGSQRYLDMLKEHVYKNITYNYAILSLCEEVRIGLGEQTVKDEVTNTLKELTDELGGITKYKKYLKENHLTDRFLRFSTEVSILEKELLYVYVDDLGLIENDDEELYEIIKDEFIVVRHIFVSKNTENAEDKIEEAKSRIDGGEDFSVLMEQYNEDTEVTAEGIFILEGYMTQNYEDIAFNMKKDEVSGIVSDENGYYVIQRLETSVPSLMMQFDYLKELYQTYTLYSFIDEKQQQLTFIPTSEGENYMNAPFEK